MTAMILPPSIQSLFITVFGIDHSHIHIGFSLKGLEIPVSILLMKGNIDKHVHGAAAALESLDSVEPLVL
jgi:hypothetical protein